MESFPLYVSKMSSKCHHLSRSVCLYVYEEEVCMIGLSSVTPGAVSIWYLCNFSGLSYE